MEPRDILAALSAPFDPSEVKFKPQMVKNNRALAMPYVDARVIQDRLDEVLGVVGWQDDYQLLPDGSVACKLRVRIGDEWVTKMDVGSPSEQPDGGDRMKAAFSDALKRAAVKFGVGRYLYRIASQWVDYDSVKKQFARPPQLPAFAQPGGSGRSTAKPADKVAPSPFVVLRNLLQNSTAEPALKSAYGAAYKAHEKGEVTDEEFAKLTALKDTLKAKLAAQPA